MNLIVLLFANFTAEELLEAKRHLKPNSWATEVGILCGVIGLLTLLLIIWAAFIRKTPRRRRSRDKKPEPASGQSIAEANVNGRNGGPIGGNGSSGGGGRSARKRRRRRAHRPRNPTLAETGGLHPIRPEEPAELG